jgi:hypothetical protein
LKECIPLNRDAFFFSRPPTRIGEDKSDRQPFQGDFLAFLDLDSSSNRAVETCGLFF